MTAATHGRSRQTGCELFAALMKGERTMAQLCEATGIARKNAELWVREMHSSGLVYRRRMQAQASGRTPVVWCLQPEPFACLDWV